MGIPEGGIVVVSRLWRDPIRLPAAKVKSHGFSRAWFAQESSWFNPPLLLRTHIVADRLGPYVLPEFRSIVIQEDAALSKESLTRPVIEPQ